MRLSIVVALVASGALLAIADDKTDLNGYWKGVNVERKTKNPAKIKQGDFVQRNPLGDSWEFKDERIVWDSSVGPADKRHGEYKYSINSKNLPKQIDWVRSNGQTIKGIYRVENDTLKVCHIINADRSVSKERPTSFDVSKRDDIIVLTFKREK